MICCNMKFLYLLNCGFAISGLGLMGKAVSSDDWLYVEEHITMPLNQSVDVKVSLRLGLWRVCFLAGEESGRCFSLTHIQPMNVQLISESTVNFLKRMSFVTPLTTISLILMFIAFILSNIEYVWPRRGIVACISGVIFFLSGLVLMVSLALYPVLIDDARLNKTIEFTYGTPFSLADTALLLVVFAGVVSLYHYMIRDYLTEKSFPPPLIYYRPRFTDSSDFWDQVFCSGPYEISSEASVQISTSHPGLLKCLDYDQV